MSDQPSTDPFADALATWEREKAAYSDDQKRASSQRAGFANNWCVMLRQFANAIHSTHMSRHNLSLDVGPVDQQKGTVTVILSGYGLTGSKQQLQPLTLALDVSSNRIEAHYPDNAIEHFSYVNPPTEQAFKEILAPYVLRALRPTLKHPI